MNDISPDPTTGQDWAESRPAPARPAATVIVARPGAEGPEVLMVRRRSGGTFGGMWVFPGGRVDPADYTAAGLVPEQELSGPEEIAVATVAAVREATEEAGLRLDPGSLVAHSHWTPPAEAGRRYTTWFFVAPAPPTADVSVDRAEVREHRWVRPRAGIAARDAGTFPLAAPTWMTLWQLTGFDSVDGLIGAARVAEPRRFVTEMQPQPDGLVFAWPGEGLRLLAPETEAWQVEVGPAGKA
jgi:8-oxo-dGTP pyrophosphatase MutT (NUDIX family)